MSGSRIYVYIPDDDKIEKRIIDNIHKVFEESILMGDFRISLTEHIAVFKFPDDAVEIADTEDLIRSTLSSIFDEPPKTVVL